MFTAKMHSIQMHRLFNYKRNQTAATHTQTEKPQYLFACDVQQLQRK